MGKFLREFKEIYLTSSRGLKHCSRKFWNFWALRIALVNFDKS